MVKTYYSNPKMYGCCKSYWITVLILLFMFLGKLYLKLQKFIIYSYYIIQILHILLHWNQGWHKPKLGRLDMNANPSMDLGLINIRDNLALYRPCEKPIKINCNLSNSPSAQRQSMSSLTQLPSART
jgi:hypothetical protein